MIPDIGNRTVAAQVGGQVNRIVHGVDIRDVGHRQISRQRESAGAAVVDLGIVHHQVVDRDRAAGGAAPKQARFGNDRIRARAAETQRISGEGVTAARRRRQHPVIIGLIIFARSRHRAPIPIARGVEGGRGRPPRVAVGHGDQIGREIVIRPQRIVRQKLPLRQRHVADAHFRIVIVGVGITAPLRTPQPVVHVMNVREVIAYVNAPHQKAVAIPFPTAAVCGVEPHAIGEGNRIVMLHARRRCQTRSVRGQCPANPAGKQLLGNIRADRIAQQNGVIAGGRAGGRIAHRTGVFTRRTEAVTRIRATAKIHDARIVWSGERSGPNFNGEVGLRGNDPIGQVNVGRHRTHGDVARRPARYAQRTAGVGRASSAHDGGSTGYFIQISRAGGGRTGRIREAPAQYHVVQGRAGGDVIRLVLHPLRAVTGVVTAVGQRAVAAIVIERAQHLCAAPPDVRVGVKIRPRGAAAAVIMQHDGLGRDHAVIMRTPVVVPAGLVRDHDQPPPRAVDAGINSRLISVAGRSGARVRRINDLICANTCRIVSHIRVGWVRSEQSKHTIIVLSNRVPAGHDVTQEVKARAGAGLVIQRIAPNHAVGHGRLGVGLPPPCRSR